MAVVAVIGAGPAGLMAAETVARAGHQVTIFDQMKSPARKFLMAGIGGLNLTHIGDLNSEVLPAYFHLPEQVERAVRAFTPADLCDFSDELGEPSFVGSSGKIFPKSFKGSPFLRAWLRRLGDLGVQLETDHRWIDWSSGRLHFQTGTQKRFNFDADAIVLALGGASWPRLGSDGKATNKLIAPVTGVQPFYPSNMGVNVKWTDRFRGEFAGRPLKAIALTVGDKQFVGELLITQYGLEGSAIYAATQAVREALVFGTAEFAIHLRPHMRQTEIADRIARTSQKNPKASRSNLLRKALRLDAVERGILYEAGPMPHDPDRIASRIASLPLVAHGHQGLERAISSGGGVVTQDLNEDLMIERRPGTFVAGEMLDYDAPTGGYLLQAAFATGRLAGNGVVRFLAQS